MQVPKASSKHRFALLAFFMYLPAVLLFLSCLLPIGGNAMNDPHDATNTTCHAVLVHDSGVQSTLKPRIAF